MVANFDVCKRYEKVLASAAFAPCSPAPVGTVPSRLRGEVADGEAADGTGELWTVVSFHMTTTGYKHLAQRWQHWSHRGSVAVR